MATGLPPLLKVAEVAEALRVHENTIYKWAKDGTLDSVHVGGAIRFRREDIERLLAGEPVA